MNKEVVKLTILENLKLEDPDKFETRRILENAQQLVLDPSELNRQTGRTTRLIIEALAVLREGGIVGISSVSSGSTDIIYKMIMIYTDELSKGYWPFPSRDTVKSRLYKMPKCSKEDALNWNVKAFDYVLFDHSIYDSEELNESNENNCEVNSEIYFIDEVSEMTKQALEEQSDKELNELVEEIKKEIVRRAKSGKISASINFPEGLFSLDSPAKEKWNKAIVIFNDLGFSVNVLYSQFKIIIFWN